MPAATPAGDRAGRFCDGVRHDQAVITTAVQDASQVRRRGRTASGRWSRRRPSPSSGEWGRLTELVELAADLDPADLQARTRLVTAAYESEGDVQHVVTWVRGTCGVDLMVPPPVTAAPAPSTTAPALNAVSDRSVKYVSVSAAGGGARRGSTGGSPLFTIQGGNLAQAIQEPSCRIVLVGALGLVAAACGSDSNVRRGARPRPAGRPPPPQRGTTTAAGGATTTAGGGATTHRGAGRGRHQQAVRARSVDRRDERQERRAVHRRHPVRGREAAQGRGRARSSSGSRTRRVTRPAASPSTPAAVEAAAKYINEELGGLGSNPSEGKAGRPIKLETCFMAINPADSQKCANELAGKKPFVVHLVAELLRQPLPDLRAGRHQRGRRHADHGRRLHRSSAFSIGAGGGCLGAHTGAVFAATQELKGKRVAVPWADTPPASSATTTSRRSRSTSSRARCTGDSKLAGTIPDLQQIGVPVKPASPDVTPQVTQVLDFKPDVIIFSAQGADCWNFVDGLGRLGWTPDKIPLVLTGSCIDLEKMKAAGDLAKGIYFVGAAGANLTNPELDRGPALPARGHHATWTRPSEYGMPAADITKGFGGPGLERR